MIDDSAAWRDELVAVADRLEAATKQKRWGERTGFLIERDFVWSAYIVGKLAETGAAEGNRKRRVPARRYDFTASSPDPNVTDDIADSYDFDNGRRTLLPVADLCHEIVNNVVFAFCCGETTDLYDGIYAASNRNRSDHVHLVLASDYIALCYDISAG
ncbi:MAG: hypothetical protein ACXVGO_16750 [Mycobacterium sp.]